MIEMPYIIQHEQPARSNHRALSTVLYGLKPAP